MSMMDALKSAGGRVRRMVEPDAVNVPKRLSIAEQYAALSTLASVPISIDVNSATWAGVRSWCANELLKARMAWERPGMTETQTAVLRERTRILKELLELKPQGPKGELKELDAVGPEIP